MRYWIEPRDDYLYAALAGRETAAQMREFLHAVQAACREQRCPRILVSVRASRASFKPEDYGLDNGAPGYAKDLVTPACRVALLADSSELNAAHEYIELCARGQKINVRAFRDEAEALRWLKNAGTGPEWRRYRLSAAVLQGAPAEPGVYALWEHDEIVYYGRARDLRAQLQHHLAAGTAATHYSWETSADAATREAELMRDFERLNGRRPRDNAA